MCQCACTWILANSKIICTSDASDFSPSVHPQYGSGTTPPLLVYLRIVNFTRCEGQVHLVLRINPENAMILQRLTPAAYTLSLAFTRVPDGRPATVIDMRVMDMSENRRMPYNAENAENAWANL